MKLSTFNYGVAIYCAVVAAYLSFFSQDDNSYTWAWIEAAFAMANLWFANFLHDRDR